MTIWVLSVPHGNPAPGTEFCQLLEFPIHQGQLIFSIKSQAVHMWKLIRKPLSPLIYSALAAKAAIDSRGQMGVAMYQ